MITAIVSGDYYASPDDFLVLADGMNLEEEKKRWRDWYENSYCKGFDQYTSFIEWILERGARRATNEEIIVWQDW